MRRLYAVLTALLCLLALPAVAGASGRTVVRDCTDNGRIDSKHSQSDYKSALNKLPSDVDEYTDCRTIIEQAKRRDARSSSNSGGGSGGGSTGSGGGSVGTGGGLGGGFDSVTPPPASNFPPPSPVESGAVAQAAAAGGAPVAVAGEPITPGGTGISEAAIRHDIPGPLLVFIVLLGLGALAMTVSGGRARGLRLPGGAHRVFDRVFPRRA